MTERSKVVLTCPPLVSYDRATLHAAAAEIESGIAPTLNRMVTDYGAYRDACRALQRGR